LRPAKFISAGTMAEPHDDATDSPNLNFVLSVS
jgi:hypothetical protein